MQEEALDFSMRHFDTKQHSMRPASTLSNEPKRNIFTSPFLNASMLQEAQRHFLEQMIPFAMLPTSANMATNNLVQMPQTTLLANHPLPTTSLALTTLQKRRRRMSESEEISNAKKFRLIADERKDDAYWERRRKNNEAAKRSRDARKAKEEEIAFRAAILEQENLKLKAQLTMLKGEIARLQSLIFIQQTQQP